MPPAGTILLEVEGATVTFANLIAVRQATFALRAGCLLGLIGPNGAGKTTLLRAIASLQPMSGGQVRILGEVRRPGDEEAARMIGFTPDVPPLYNSLTVLQFLNFIAAGYGINPENTLPTIDFWLEKVWLRDKRHLRIRALSRGMKQRLGIARTLLPNPNIILLDEPAAGLDPAGRVQFRKLLTDLRDQGKALIVSSHILSDMEDYCTHIAIMSHGSIIHFGTVQEIAAGVDTGRCRYVIELAAAVAGVQEMVRALPGVDQVAAERLTLTLDYDSDPAAAAGLLQSLVRLGLPVAAFQPFKPGLEQAYLRAGIRQVD